MEQKLRKPVAWLLTLAMIFTMLPSFTFTALAADNLCEHHAEHTAECGYVEGVSDCAYHCDVCLGHDHGDEVTEENTEPAPVCDCGTDDPAIHATTCAVYVAPENPVCYCAEKCSDTNEWCDVCGFDYTACTGTDTAVQYAEDASPYAVIDTEAGTLTIDGTFGGKAEATDDEVAALTETIKDFVTNGGSAVIVTGSEMAIHYNGDYDNYPAYADALYYVTDADSDTEFNGKVDLILPDATTLVECAFASIYCLRSITLPKVTTIGDAAFWECRYLQTLTFGSVVTSIGSKIAFLNVGLKVEGGTNLVLNCGQMEGNYIPDIDKKEWCYDQAQQDNYTWKSITLTHTGACDECRPINNL